MIPVVIEYTQPGVWKEDRVIKYMYAKTLDEARRMVEKLYADRVLNLFLRCDKFAFEIDCKNLEEFQYMLKTFFRFTFYLDARAFIDGEWQTIEIRNRESVDEAIDISRVDYEVLKMETKLACAANIKLLLDRYECCTECHFCPMGYTRENMDRYIDYIITGRVHRKFNVWDLDSFKKGLVMVRSYATRGLRKDTNFYYWLMKGEFLTSCIDQMVRDIKTLKNVVGNRDDESDSDDESESDDEESARSADYIATVKEK